MARFCACRTVGFKSPRSQASRRSGFTRSRLATGSGGYPLSCRAQVSTVGLTSAGVEVLIFLLYPVFSALGNSRKNQDFGPNLHGLLIGIYLFYENWSTETFRKSEKSGLFVSPTRPQRKSCQGIKDYGLKMMHAGSIYENQIETF